MKVLITGPSGAGKTELRNFLGQINFNAIDSDSIGGLGAWKDKQGNSGVVPPDAGPPLLQKYRYYWDLPLLEEALSWHQDVIFTGIAENAIDSAHLFDRHCCLQVDAPTLKRRIVEDTKSNRFGKTPFQQSRVLHNAPGLYRRAEEAGFTLVNANGSIREVASIILNDLLNSEPSSGLFDGTLFLAEA